ncbi:MAG TPA: cytochrome c oxidase assembly protein [Solirubrobacterales bacterium]|nr:cytochrome c oxidase assembly protein [Solirubrobacterales bacterium]
MELPGFLSEWELDGTIGLAFTLLTVAVGVVYVAAAEAGRRRDRRRRRWPPRRTACFLAGLAVLVVALDSGIGAGADERLTDHMVEHMLIWLAVAPLLVAGAPVRLALFATGARGRRRLGRALHSAPVRVVSGPLFSTLAFSLVVVATMVPAFFDLTLEDDLIHVAEHALYLATAVLVWTPLIGADPLPHRLGVGGRCRCVVACMAPMAAVSAWLLSAGAPLYEPYRQALGAAALADQRLAGLIMLAAALPAIAIAVAAPGARSNARLRPEKVELT